MEQGFIRRIVSNKNFGFIESDGKDNIFFHKEDVQPNSLYDELSEGDEVQFMIDKTPKGPRARNVERVTDAN